MSQDCFLNSKDGKNFGSSRGLSGLVRLSECNDEVKHHLISYHLSKEVLSENVCKNGKFNEQFQFQFSKKRTISNFAA